MNIRKTSITVVLAAAAGLAIAACGSGATGGASGSPSGAAASSAAASPGTAASTGTSTGAPAGAGASAAAGSGTAAAGGAGGATVTATGGAARCHTANLGFAWGAPGPSAAGGQRSVAVKLTNKGTAACSMRGFPGVDLVNSGQSWSLPRSSGGPHGTVTLTPGASTSFTLVYRADIGAGGTPYTPTTAVITPPDETTSYDLPWTYGRLIKDSTTYVEPVG